MSLSSSFSELSRLSFESFETTLEVQRALGDFPSIADGGSGRVLERTRAQKQRLFFFDSVRILGWQDVENTVVTAKFIRPRIFPVQARLVLLEASFVRDFAACSFAI